MLLGDVLQAEADASLNPKLSDILQSFDMKAQQEVSSGYFHVIYITEPVIHDAAAGRALAQTVQDALQAWQVPTDQCFVKAYKWNYTIDPGFHHSCLNEDATYGFVIRIDYWAKGVKPSRAPTIEGKLMTPGGYQEHVRADEEGIHSLWQDDDGDVDLRCEYDRLRAKLPILGRTTSAPSIQSAGYRLGSVLQICANAYMGRQVECVVRGFFSKLAGARQPLVTHVSGVVAPQMVAAGAIAVAVNAHLTQHRIDPRSFVVTAHEWKFVIDPGFTADCLNESASHGFVVRVDCWMRGARFQQLPSVEMKLHTPSGGEDSVRADATGVYSLWSDPELDGDFSDHHDFDDGGHDDLFDDFGDVYDDPADFDFFDEYD